MRIRPFARARRLGRGSVIILVMIFLVLFATLAMGFSAATNLSLHQAQNNYQAQNAQMAAESGLAFMTAHMRVLTINSNDIDNGLLEAMGNNLALLINGSANLNGQFVSVSPTQVVVPSITATSDGHTFHAVLTPSGADGVLVSVIGRYGPLTRTVTMRFELQGKRSGVFDYGIASRGKVALWGNTLVDGTQDSVEASILSTKQDDEAIYVRGNVTVGGDLHASDHDATVSIQGNSAEIGGETDKYLIYQDHVHIGFEEPTFPELNTSVLESFAVNTLTDSVQNFTTYENIRIPAGTNPQFGNDVVINGVVFIEAPNTVTFKSDCTINGAIVTEDASDLNIEDCQIIFKSKVDCNGVEALPNTTQWASLREQTGTFVLAPGFHLDFHGQANAVNGVLAADKLDFHGGVNLNITGSILGLNDLDTTLHGHNEIWVDTPDGDSNPAGFVKVYTMVPNADTYGETP